MGLPHFPRDEGVDRVESPPIADSARGGNLEPAERAPEAAVHVAYGNVERFAESLDLCGVDLVEARPDDDRLREAPHFADHLDNCAALGQRSPSLEHLLGGPADDGGELRVVTGLEGGLHLP